jgi:hypothetical protein
MKRLKVFHERMPQSCKVLILPVLFFILFGLVEDSRAENTLWLRFDEGAGQIAHDGSGYGNDAVINGAVWTQGKIGGGLNFSKSNYVTVRDSPSLNVQNGATVEAWVKANVSHEDYRWLWFKGSGAPPQEGILSQLWGDDGLYSYITVDNNLYTAAHMYAYPQDDLFHHVAQTVEVNGRTVIHRAYFDGILMREAVVDGIITNSNLDLIIGGANFAGIIDDVRIYNNSLSSLEILEHVYPLSTTPYSIENGVARITFDSNGLLTCISDKRNLIELVASPQRAFAYRDGTLEKYFDTLSIANNEIRLRDSRNNLGVILGYLVRNDYFVFTVKWVDVPPGLNLSSLSIRFDARLDPSTIYYLGNANFSLIGMPFSPMVTTGTNRIGPLSGSILSINIDSYPPGTSMVGQQFILMTVPDKASSFEVEDALGRIKNDLGLRQSTRPDIYGPTLFTWFNETEADAVIDFAVNAGFKNILIGSGAWNEYGYWDVKLSNFPHGLKPVIDKIHAHGLFAGLHMLPSYIHPNNPFRYSPSSILLNPDGSEYIAPADSYYLRINADNDSVMALVAENYARVIDDSGVDMIYIDGNEQIHYTNLPFYVNRFFDIFKSSLKPDISVQGSSPFIYVYPLGAKRSAITDDWQMYQYSSIKNWVDEVSIGNVLARRRSFVLPEFGWVSYHSDRSLEDYEYLLSTSIALGTPVTLENAWSDLSAPSIAPLESVLNTYNSVYNQYVGRTILQETTPSYIFTQYESGLAAFFVNTSTDLPVGLNRHVWIHAKQNSDPTINLIYSGLEPNCFYTADYNGRLGILGSDSDGVATLTLSLEANDPYNLISLAFNRTLHPADLNRDGTIDTPELLSLVEQWKMNAPTITIALLMSATEVWKEDI